MSGKGKEGRVPQIRFAGFTDPWEQRKLGDVGYATSGIGFPDAEQGGKEGIPFFKVSDMNLPENSRELVTSNNYVTESQIAANGWHPIANLPAIFFAKVGAAVYLNRKRLVDTPFLLDNNTMAFSLDTEKISSSFAQSLFEGIDLTALTQVGALPSLNAADIESLETLMPLDMGEQVKIGRYFANLDSLITLHQRKYDKLCAVKKSMLDKMFPKGGSLYPEIRFAGFTDPWEQRKFGDMYAVNNERNTNCELGYDRTLSIATMTFNGGNGAADDSLSNYKVIRVGDIAFEGHTNKVHAYGRFVLNDAGDGLMSPRFSCLRPIVEQRYAFWKYYIPREETMRPILVKATKSGTMMNELVPDDLMRESILVPCLAEQEVIGSCFTQLDHLITLHQRKLELLRNIKKAMLDKMFA